MITRTTAAPRVAGTAEASVRQARPDVVTALSVFVVVLMGLPSRLTVGALGGAGPPAILLGLVIGAWWVVDRLQRPDPDTVVRPRMRRWVIVVCVCVGISYVAAMTRAIAPSEVTTADLSTLALLSWMSVLVAGEAGITSQDRLDTLLRRIVFMGTLVAFVGLLQFLTGQLWIDRIQIPGLVTNQSLGDLGARGSFSRPSGTALHPIEFGAVLTMMLPLAINLALVDRARGWLRRWTPVAAIALLVVLSISRSAVICAVVGLIVAGLRWTPSVRRFAAVGALALLGFVFVTIPGMIGTLAGMFTSAGSDSSTLSRVDSYATAFAFIRQSPAFGRGLGTFLPTYRILDNQYLLLLIEVGVVGTMAVLALMLAGIRAASRAAKLSRGPMIQRCQALAAATSGGAVGLAFYDGFSFPMASGLLFLLLGLAGAQYRLVLTAERERPAAATPQTAPTR
jgi:O-antigen ligase